MKIIKKKTLTTVSSLYNAIHLHPCSRPDYKAQILFKILRTIWIKNKKKEMLSLLYENNNKNKQKSKRNKTKENQHLKPTKRIMITFIIFFGANLHLNGILLRTTTTKS